MKQNLSAFAVLLAAAAATAQDPVLDWNRIALDAIRATNTPPPAASRSLAILHCALHDAVNGIVGGYDQYLVPPMATPAADPRAAAIAAAHDVLVVLFPARAAVLDKEHNAQLAAIPNGPGKSNGIGWGQFVGQVSLVTRIGDGSATTVSYPGSNLPGMWRPTISFGGIVRPALSPQWGSVRPFAMTSNTQFAPPPPPDLASFQYGIETLHVQYYGSRSNSLRTPDQTQIASFWAYGPGTATPPGHWNQAAQSVARKTPRSLSEHARTFALLNIALADAAICSWQCKYVFGLWRPITAIPLADTDGNPLTNSDPNWMPWLETPPFPEYTSGHSTFSGAAAAVLTSAYGANRAFVVESDDLPGVVRSYASFTDAAWESGMSRIYGGIHFYSANVHGLLTGWSIGTWAVGQKLRPR